VGGPVADGEGDPAAPRLQEPSHRHGPHAVGRVGEDRAAALQAPEHHEVVEGLQADRDDRRREPPQVREPDLGVALPDVAAAAQKRLRSRREKPRRRRTRSESVAASIALAISRSGTGSPCWKARRVASAAAPQLRSHRCITTFLRRIS
jgi:hypothetical protein